MAIGASGSRIQLLARIIGSQPIEGSTATIFVIEYRLSEPTIDGNNLDGKLTGDVGFEIDLRTSDLEIHAELRARLSAQLTQDLTPTDPFIATDVRFGMALGAVAESGAAAKLGAELNGIAADFIDRSVVIRDTTTPANDYTGVPSGRLTINRASTAYYLNSYGILTLAAINEARDDDHYPVTLLPRGLMAEDSRTNLALQSEDAATTWTSTDITVTSNTGVGMRGTTTADKLTATAANGTHTQAIAATAVPYTFSVWLRRITGTGNIDISADGVTWVTVPVTTTLTRFETTLTLTAATYNPGIRIVTSGDEVERDGADFEAGGYASSYIPTTTIAVTRSADNCSIAGSSFPLSQTEGTLVLEVEYAGTIIGAGSAQAAGTMLLGDGTANDRIRLGASNGGALSQMLVNDNGVQQANVTLAGSAINTVYKLGGVYAAGDFHHARDGVLSGSPDSAGALPTTTTLYFGGIANGLSTNTAWYRSFLYLPRRVTNAELEALTA